MSINVQELLRVAYGGDPQERRAATSQLEEAMKSSDGPQHVISLLRSGVDPSLAPEQSLSALIYVKNTLMHTIPDEVVEKYPGFLDEMKMLLFQGALNTPESHRRIIHVCVSTLISGFQWNYIPEIMPLVLAVKDRDSEHSLAVLELLFTYVQRFKTALLEDMKYKLEVCQPLVEVLVEYLNFHDPRIDRYVFKLLECVVEVALEQTNTKEVAADSLDVWFNLMLRYPEENFSAASAAGGKALEEYIKCVKRIASISFSALNDGTRKKKPSPVAAHFTANFGETYLLLWIRWLTAQTDSTSRSLYMESYLNALRYIKLSTLDEKLYKQIRVNAVSFIESTLFPFLMYNETDDEIFADEEGLPEYVQYMMEESFGNGEYSLRQAASNAILAMIGGKKMFHDSASLLQEILGVLTNGLSLEENDANFPSLFGFLHLLSILRKYIKMVPEIWNQQMANVLKTYIAPRMNPSSKYPALRCKALVVCQRYSKVPMAEEDFQSFVQMICGLVEDKDARVRLAAIDAVCTLLEKKAARVYLKRFLIPLMEECMLFLNKVQTKFVPTVILHLATHFSPELGPVMGRLGHTLVQHFLGSAFDMENMEEAENLDLAVYEQAFFSADALLDAIYTVVTSCSENMEAFEAMRPDLLRLIQKVLEQPDCFDFMEKTLCIYVHVVNFSKPIPPECWSLLPLLQKTVDEGIGVDFFNLIEEVLDNYISGSPVEYISNVPLMESTFVMCQKMLLGGVVCAAECQVAAAMLVEALLHQAKSCAQPAIFEPQLPRYVMMLLQALINPDIEKSEPIVRIWVIAALMDSFYYNAETTLNIICEANAYPQFLEGLFYFFRACFAEPGQNSITSTSAGGKKKKKGKKAAETGEDVVEALSLLTRKVISLGLSSFLQYICSNSQHPAYTSFVENYLAKTLQLVQYCLFTNVTRYKGRTELARKNITAIQEGFEEDIEDCDEGILGVDEVGGEEGEGEEVLEDFSDADDWEVGMEGQPFGAEPDEGDDYSSPIDEINEVDFFGQFLSSMSNFNPVVQQSITQVLQPQHNYQEASTITDQYMSACKDLEKAMEEDYKKRASGAV